MRRSPLATTPLLVLAGLLVLSGFASGCDREEEPAPVKERAAPAPAPEPLSLTPPEPRLANPPVLIERRLPEDAHAGRIRGAADSPWRPLAAVGLNLCQTGWMLQGFARTDDGLEATATFPLAMAEIPTGREVRYEAPDVEGSALKFRFEEASLQRLKGWFAVVEGEEQRETLRMEIDAAPIGIASGEGMGVQGCYTTGFYRIRDAGQTAVGPATAVYDGKRAYYVGLRLSPTHTLAFWLDLPPNLRKPQNLLRGDLARVREAPQNFPFRVALERRVDAADAAPPARTELRTDATPIPAGELVAAFGSPRPEGPLRIRLADVQIPADWEGPLAGRTLDEILVEVSFVAHADRAIVPIPRMPNWDVVGPE